MTISTTASRASYNGNGVTTAFAFPNLFFSNTDLIVILVNASGVSVTQVLNTDYTVTGAGLDAGGTVTMTVAPGVGERLVIVRQVPLVQETDYTAGDSFPAESHERALDYLTMQTQQLQEALTRTLQLPVTSDADASAIDPSAVETVAGIAANVTTVALNDADVTTVATNIADVNTVAGISGNVTTVAGISGNVTTVAGIAVDISTLAAIDDQVVAVAADLPNLNIKVGRTSATGSAIIPNGTTAQRDGSPLAGYFRFNQTLLKFEGYNGTAWGAVGGGATGGGSDEVFVENTRIVTTNYTLPALRNAHSVGPITIDDGVTVTVPDGCRWVVS